MWPPKIISLFEAVDFQSNDETQWYGPFNALLDFCFPWENDWNIVPQYRQPKKKETIDFTTIYIVEKKRIPVFFMEIKPLDHIENISTRSSADEQMRDRFASLLPLIKTDILHGISALGIKLSHYYLDKETLKIEPPGIIKDPSIIKDIAPAIRWNIEILKDDGYEKFMDIVKQIKSMSNSILK